MKKISVVFKSLFIISIVIGFFLIGRGIAVKVELDKKIKTYEEVEGYYIGKELYSEDNLESKHSGHDTYACVYLYTVDGIDYTVRTDFGTEVFPEIGSGKKILYNPKNPSESLMEGTNGASILLFVGVFFVLISGFMVFVMMLFAHKIGNISFNTMDIVMGFIFLFVGIGFIYMIAGTSINELFLFVGPFGVIPITFVVVGVFLLGRGILVKKES